MNEELKISIKSGNESSLYELTGSNNTVCNIYVASTTDGVINYATTVDTQTLEGEVTICTSTDLKYCIDFAMNEISRSGEGWI